MEVKLDTKCDKFLPRSENSGKRIIVKQFNKTERKVFLNCMHPLYVKSKRVTNYRARLHTARHLFHPHHLDGDWKKKEHLLVIILWKRDSFGAKNSHRSHPPWSCPRHPGWWQRCSCPPCPPNSRQPLQLRPFQALKLGGQPLRITGETWAK